MSKSTATTQYLRIGQIAERTGMSAKALRLYEARGLLAPDARSASGYRLYGPRRWRVWPKSRCCVAPASR